MDSDSFKFILWLTSSSLLKISRFHHGIYTYICIYIYMGAVLGVELRASHMLGRCSTTPPALFALGAFQIGSHFMLRLTWIGIFLFSYPM
jgi:hypothetical protein